jgi:hypothetical protein
LKEAGGRRGLKRKGLAPLFFSRLANILGERHG